MIGGLYKMEQDRINDLIKKAVTEAFFVGGTDDSNINEIENQLNVKLPDSYKWFLKTYGHGSLCGVLVLGVGKDKNLVCVKETERRRSLGLPSQYVVIENCDEWQYCIDTGNLKDGECCVVDWERGETGKRTFKNFYEYVIERFSEAMEDME